MCVKHVYSRLKMDEIRRIFDETVTSENIFGLLTHLNSSNHTGVTETLQVLTLAIKDAGRSQNDKSPERLVSFGVYLALILRFQPDSQLYVEGEHFLAVILQTFYPYVALFITMILVPVHLAGINIDTAVRESHRDQSSNSDSELRLSKETQEALEKVTQWSPTRGKVFRADASASGEISPPLRPPVETVLGRTMSLCNLGSPERATLLELKRGNGRGILRRIGAQNQKHEWAIFLDNPDFLDGELSEDDIEKAIYMHANRIVLSDPSILMPHHFDRALACLNYPIARSLEYRADWVSLETLDEIFYSARKLKHALCLELLLLAARKNIGICDHLLKKLPEDWQVKILEVYTQPRWRSISQQSPIPEKHATLDHYRLHLGIQDENNGRLCRKLADLNFKLNTSEKVDEFLEQVRNMNKSYYILQLSGYSDFLSEQKLVFGNDRDLMGDDVFDLSRNFVFALREGDRIFLLDYGTARTLAQKGENPYTRTPIPEKVREEALSRFQQYNTLGLSTDTTPLPDLISELTNGRSKLKICTCAGSKNYRRKLIRLLRNYGVRDESLEVVVIADVIFKLSLMAVDLQATTKEELWEKLYRAIKSSPPEKREALRRTIASIIKMYSQIIPGAMIIGF